MSSGVPLPPPGFDELPTEEKLAYLQSLWERIAVDSEAVPVPDWHGAVLRERLAEHERSPGDVSGWPEARRRIEEDLEKGSG